MIAPAAPTDEALARAAVEGDESALADLLARYAPLLNRVLARTNIFERERDDVKQDCRFAAWRNIFKGWLADGCRGRLVGYLAAAWHHECVHHIAAAQRAKRGGRQEQVPMPPDLTAPASTDPLARLIAAERQAEMAQLWGRSFPEGGRIFPLLLAGYTPKQIDHQLGLARGRTKCIVSKMRGRLGLRVQNDVEQMNEHGTVIARYPSAAAAGRATGIAKEHIAACCRRDIKQISGTRWRLART